MTRANLNFVYDDKGKETILYYYQNGDQYPRGIRDFYHILDWLNDENKFNAKGFREWLGANYKETKAIAYKNGNMTLVSNYEPTEIPAKPEKKTFTIMGDLTDYSYLFDSIHNKVKVLEWEETIFEGTRQEFCKWLKNYKEEF
jgi:hypothetical protein